MMAKPAVPFGGKYRIIDFPLSNCTNSGIDTVGVLTQYQSAGAERLYRLRPAVGSRPDQRRRVTCCRPIMTARRGEWYQAARPTPSIRTSAFIEQYDPGVRADPLRRPHLQDGLQRDAGNPIKQNGADVTIAVREVPWEEAPRFGIHEHGRETTASPSLRRSPAKPKSNKASMGVYIFSWSKLRKYLELTTRPIPNSSNDFGKNIIPTMLERRREACMAYTFEGYWKDVGTIESPLGSEHGPARRCPCRFDLYDNALAHLRPQPGHAAALHRPTARSSINCMITEGCEVKRRHAITPCSSRA